MNFPERLENYQKLIKLLLLQYNYTYLKFEKQAKGKNERKREKNIKNDVNAFKKKTPFGL